MTQQQYMSNDLVCEYLYDIEILYSIVSKIDNLEQVYAVSGGHDITYRYQSHLKESIDALHAAWNEYLDGV